MAKKSEEILAADAVIEIARKSKGMDEDGVYTLSSDVRVKVHPVTAALIDQVTARIKDPEPPIWHDDDRDRDVPNYSDPIYVKKLADAERERGIAAMDALVMFGFELVDGLPEDSVWVRKLRLLGIEVDLDDELALEFAYKKYVAVAPEEMSLVTEMSGISPEELKAAEDSFRGNA